MSTTGSRDRVVAGEIEDPFLRRSVKTALHLRRYMPFYVFGTIWIITLAAFPSIRGGDGDNDNGSNVASTQFADESTTDAGAIDATGATTDEVGDTAGATTGGASTGAVGTANTGTKAGAPRTGAVAGTTGAAAPSGGGAASQPVSAEQAASAIQRETGTTRLGQPCGPGVLQIPNSTYAPPCQNVYDGPNGGATWPRGVTDKEITIVRRKFPDSANSRAVDEVNSRAGYASSDVTDAVRLKFIEYFNKSFELYGRQVKWVVYESQNGDSTAEAQSKGKEGACLDADYISKELKAFGVLGNATWPFSECAAERKLMAFNAGAYYPERWYRKYHPYLWGTVMECERISYQVAEYVGKRLLNRPARWAGDAVTQKKTRLFGTYVPDNDGFQQCVQITRNEIKNKYGGDPGPRYDYQLDISRFPDQAAQAAVQFSAAGVTTVILACDYISATVLTAAAERQGWRPEWMTIGTGATDVDNSARLYEQAQVNGHLFGPSQLGATQKLIGPDSEPGRVYKDATGKTIPEGTTGDYFFLIHMFDMLQAAGPVLTPENMAKGAMTLPPSGQPGYAFGYWSYLDGPDGTPGAGDHTTVDDSREVYWVAQTKSGVAQGSASDKYYNGPDGKDGTYKEVNNGQRYRNGEWPPDEPAIYPPR
jgi:hypothetical protein